jgi:hypothetical protein
MFMHRIILLLTLDRGEGAIFCDAPYEVQDSNIILCLSGHKRVSDPMMKSPLLSFAIELGRVGPSS